MSAVLGTQRTVGVVAEVTTVKEIIVIVEVECCHASAAVGRHRWVRQSLRVVQWGQTMERLWHDINRGGLCHGVKMGKFAT